jgi:glycosyltransferase involved in cell wall biosynthesis
MGRTGTKLISVVLAAFNEEENVKPFYEALTQVLGGLEPDYDREILFVNDGSCDDTLLELKKLAAQDHRVRVLSFSRNFGQQAAFSAGLDRAKGDVVVTMDCDLQDPPELIAEMVKEWEQGYKVVYARRTVRDDNLFKKYTAAIYYRLLSSVSDVDIPRQVGDFRLMDRTVVSNLIGLGERARYLRGMVAWLGFKHTFVDFERPERVHGETHYPLKKMVKLAMDGLLSFSLSPLKLAMWVGILSILVAGYFFGYMLYDHFVRGVEYALFKWLTVILFGFMGAQFMLLWIVGEYIGRIYNDVRKRPVYVVDEEISSDNEGVE